MAAKKDSQEIANAGIKVLVSLLPGGGAINELLGLVIAPVLDTRRERWLEALDYELSKVRQRVEGFSIEDLRKKESFTSAFLQATRVALTTHQNEKVDALRNVLQYRIRRRSR
jgi:hypothetical protein